MGVTCDILLKANTQGAYKAGQAVQGLVKYAIDKPTEFSSVTVSLRGQGSCQWLGGLYHIGSTCIGTEDYVDQRMDLLEAKKGTIAAGTYEKEFRFVLPETIPSSYKDFKCFIEYFIELVFIKSNGKRIYKRLDLIKVQGGIKPRFEQQATTYDATARRPSSNETITFNVTVEKTHLNPGQGIILNVNVNNLRAVSDIVIRTELIEDITYKSNCNHMKKITRTLNGTEVKFYGAEIDPKRRDTLMFDTAADIFTIHSNIITREYRVKVVYKLPLPYEEASIEIPMVISEEIEVSEKVKSVDLPPSYSKIMNEYKKKFSG